MLSNRLKQGLKVPSWLFSYYLGKKRKSDIQCNNGKFPFIERREGVKNKTSTFLRPTGTKIRRIQHGNKKKDFCKTIKKLQNHFVKAFQTQSPLSTKKKKNSLRHSKNRTLAWFLLYTEKMGPSIDLILSRANFLRVNNKTAKALFFSIGFFFKSPKCFRGAFNAFSALKKCATRTKDKTVLLKAANLELVLSFKARSVQNKCFVFQNINNSKANLKYTNKIVLPIYSPFLEQKSERSSRTPLILKGTNSYLIPDFVEIQRRSFFQLLENGLIEEFAKRNPITNKNLEIFFYPEYYQLTPPEYNPRRAILISKSYSSKLFIPAQLTDKKLKKSQLKWVLIGNLPLMTKRGHFVLNGAPRVIVNQILRSPGIYFQGSLKEVFSDQWSEKAEITYKRFYTDLICLRGTWLRIEIDKNKDIWAQMKKVPKIPLLWFLLAMGLTERIIFKSVINPTRLLANFNLEIKRKNDYEYVTNPSDAWKQISNLISSSSSTLSVTPSPYLNSKLRTTPIINGDDLKKATEERKAKKDHSVEGLEAKWPTLLASIEGPVIFPPTFRKDSLGTKKGLVSFLNIVEHSKEGRNWIFKRFMNPRAYDLGNQGRLNFNRKLGLAISSNQTTLTAQDLLFATDYLLKVEKGLKNIDDIDHLKNRRVRTSGELLQIQIGIGLVRLEKIIRDKLSKINAQMRASDFLTSRPNKPKIKLSPMRNNYTRRAQVKGGPSYFAQKALFRASILFEKGLNGRSRPLRGAQRQSRPFLETKRGHRGARTATTQGHLHTPSLKKSELTKKLQNKSQRVLPLHLSTALYVARQWSNKKSEVYTTLLGNTSSNKVTFPKTHTKNMVPGSFRQETIEGLQKSFIIKNKGNVNLKKASNLNTEEFKMTNLINTKAFNGALREFFGSSQLSQFMDQLNPLAEITHKRRLSSMGPGGVTRDSATLAIRGIHPTHYGRICPIETPEGKNTGLVNSLTTYARANSQGFLESPFYKVYKGQIQKNAGMFFLSAEQEENIKLAAADVATPLGRIEFLPKYKIPAKVAYGDTISKISRNIVEYIGVSPIQMISIATSLIPFLEHDDANRALMGSNMQRQAVPLLRAERPLVGTGLESRTVSDSGHAVIAKESGYVAYVSAKKLVIYTRFRQN